MNQMKTSINDDVTYIEYQRQTPVSLLQLLRSFPEAVVKHETFKKLSIDTPLTNISASYRKISDGFWYMRFEQLYRRKTEIKICKTEEDHFYELEYFFVDKHEAIQRDSNDDAFSLHSTAVFSSSHNDKTIEIEEGTNLTTYKFIFTRDFLEENFYVDDPYLQFTILKKIIANEQPCYHRHIHDEELSLISNLEKTINTQKSQLLQIIRLKAIVLQLFGKFFEMQVHPTSYYTEHASIFSEALKLMKSNIETNFPGLAVLAACCNVSVPTFKRKFKAFFLSTPENYYRQLQMEQAEMLMKKPGTTVREVAGRFGYLSQQSFSTRYKKIKGYFPSTLKKGV